MTRADWFFIGLVALWTIAATITVIFIHWSRTA
jgi:hypothetical protein